MCEDQPVDTWTLCHIAVAAALGAASRQLCIRSKWTLCVFLLVLWELFEFTGRELGWTWVPDWFECESWTNIAADLLLGVAGVALGLAVHKKLRRTGGCDGK